MASLTHLVSVLEAAGEQFYVLLLQGEGRALITRRGGRVLGLFPAADSENLLWTNKAAFADLGTFQSFAESGNWNIGGERIWIAPEIQYGVRDRDAYWETVHVQPAMDPGDYVLQANEEKPDKTSVHLSAHMQLQAYNIGTGEQSIEVIHRLAPVRNPLHHQSDLMADVVYCGYERFVTLNEKSSTAYSTAWNLVQLIAGGQLLIPCMPVVQAEDYYVGNVPEEARQVRQGDVPHLRLHLTGKSQYKLGYQSSSMTGRMAYYHVLPDGTAYLLVRHFFNDPSNLYVEEAPHQPGVNRHSVHVYNDGGEFGGDTSFGEMECSGHTLHAGAMDTETDRFVLWAYTGAADSLRRIAHLLLGIQL